MKRVVLCFSVAVTCLVLASGTARAGSLIIENTFGPGGSFATGLLQAYGIVGSRPLLSLSPAVQFVPEFSSQLDTISVAVGKGLLGSSFGFNINLLADNGGHPGAVLESWVGLTPNYTYTAGGVPVTVTDALGLWLNEGTAYWLQVAPAVTGSLIGGTRDKWNYSNLGDSESNMTLGGPLGEIDDRIAPAFEITGNVPEPDSFVLTGIGAALIGLAALIRKFRQ